MPDLAEVLALGGGGVLFLNSTLFYENKEVRRGEGAFMGTFQRPKKHRHPEHPLKFLHSVHDR